MEHIKAYIMKHKRPLLLILGASMTALTLVFPHIGFVQWVCMIPMILPLFELCDDPSFTNRRAYGYGFLTVYVYYLILYHWFVNLYPLDFAGLEPTGALAVIAAGWFGLPLLQAIPGGLIFLFFRLIGKSGIYQKAPLLRPFVFASLWVVFEWSSTLSWVGVPWGRLALGQIDFLPMLQSASLFGSYFVSFLLLLTNGFLAYFILYQRRKTLCLSMVAGIILANYLFGAISLHFSENNAENTVKVAAIQGNINSHDKWDSSSSEHVKEVYRRLTEEAAVKGADLVVWPETALPYYLNDYPAMQRYVSSVAVDCKVTLIMGAFYVDEDGNEYNSLYMITPDGSISETVYSKRHLVPFGEYVPLRNIVMTLIPPLADISMLDGDLTAGDGDPLFASPYGKIGSLICFDSIYEQLPLKSVRNGAEIMVISSNDSWFLDSKAVYQHKAQAQLRAIENGRPYVRAANTGISAVIDEKGRVKEELAPLIEGIVVQELVPTEERTLYSYVGNLWVMLCILLCILSPAIVPTSEFIKKKLQK